MERLKKVLKFVGLIVARNLISMFIFWTVIFFIFGLLSVSSVSNIKTVKSNSVLHFPIDRAIMDRVSSNPLDNFSFYQMSPELKYGLNNILFAIDKAKTDKKITGIFLEFTGVPVSFTDVEEIRTALLDFKKSGKYVVSYSENYLHTTYYLGSVADEVYLTPTGFMTFFGIRAGQMFFKDALNKLGINVDIIRHGKFKSAGEPFLYNKMSKENREQLEYYIFDIWNKMLRSISTARSIEVDTLKELASSLSISSPQDALDNNLIDGIKYKDEIISLLKKKNNIKEKKKLNSISLTDYYRIHKKDEPIKSKKPKLAIIYAAGSIVSRSGESENISAAHLSKTIRKARLDSTIKAIVLRVNSGGGSALASEVIWREVKLAAEEKTVIASLGSMAASGGYYIVAPADTIVASDNTLTGSIGVFMAAFNAQDFLGEKLGVHVDVAKTNPYADIGSPFKVMSKKERNYFQSSIDDFYDTFIGHVADGRGLDLDFVDSIAQGHIWSGNYAKKLGLIDIIGGLEIAIDVAVRNAGLTDYIITTLPESESFIKQLIDGYTASVKEKMVKEELQENYIIYKKIKQLKKVSGIQARIPFEIDLRN